jgi:4-hydroxyphenylpyruvate 3-dimethylallyltransferase
LERTAAAIGAPYSETATIAVLDAYAKNFNNGAVLWRTTDRSGDILNYRFYERHPTDTIAVAVKNGLLEPNNSLAKLVTSWSALYDGVPEQSCDFDSDIGLSKTWVYLGDMRPLDDVLNAPGVPESIRRHRSLFHSLDLNFVRHVAVDYRKHTVNLYFRAQGPISYEQAAKFTNLAESEPPNLMLFTEMAKFISPLGYTFSVTLTSDNGIIERVGFYALKLPEGQFPTIGHRLSTFFSTAPSYDSEEMNAVAWSFGKGGKTYIKAERSYSGHLVALMKDWNSTFSS